MLTNPLIEPPSLQTFQWTIKNLLFPKSIPLAKSRQPGSDCPPLPLWDCLLMSHDPSHLKKEKRSRVLSKHVFLKTGINGLESSAYILQDKSIPIKLQNRLTNFIHHINREKPISFIFGLFQDFGGVALHLMTNENVT